MEMIFIYSAAVVADGALLWLVARWLTRRTIRKSVIVDRLNNRLR